MNAIGRLGLTLVVTTLVACAQATGASPTPSPSGLNGRQFLSTGVTQGGAAYALVPNTRIRLSFDTTGGLSVSAGCNTIGGTYVIDGNRLVITATGMTEMGCDQPRFDQDDWLNAFLAANPGFVLNGNDLTLTSGDTVITLLDREIAEPDQPLGGPTWLLDSIITGGDVVSSIPAGVSATITFHADGTVDINYGCNAGGGQYAIDGDSISFSQLIHTDMACLGAAGQIEAAVSAVLAGDLVTFTVDASSLTLTAANGDGLQFIAQ
jgi:heat shock protein HslJ